MAILKRFAAIKVTGCGLMFSDRKIMDQIVLISSGMLINSSKKASIKSDTYEGMIVTGFHKGMLGSLGGTLFDLSLDTDKGPVSLEFVLTQPVSEEELKSMLWIGHTDDVTWEDIQGKLEELFAQEEYSSTLQ